MRAGAIVFALCLLAAGALSVALGQDANWDLRNYHWYNPWALLEGRRGVDFLASGVQFYFNPTLDLPYHWLASGWLGHRPRVVAFLAGLPYGVLVFLVLLCARTVVADMDGAPRWRLPFTVLLAAFGLTGSAAISQVGTTFNEVQVAVLVIAGVAVLLAAQRDAPQGVTASAPAFGAGLLLGVAAGLKLTAAIYAPAAALALFAAAHGNVRSIRAMAVFSLAWGLAFVAAYGWWAFQLYRELGNPLFPLFENLFPTQWLTAGTWGDPRFKPQTLADALAYPFSWVHASRVVTEVEFADPRFAIAWCGFVLLLVAAIVRRGRLQTVAPRSSIFLLVFVAVGYVAWQKMFSIFRYTIPVEALLGPALAVCAWGVARLFNARVAAPAAFALGVLVLAASAAATHYPRWGRVPYGRNVVETAPAVTLEPGSLVAVMGSPQSHVLPSIARSNPSVKFVGVTGDMLNARDFAFWKSAVARIGEHPGPRYAIRPLSDPFQWFDVLPMMGLALEPATCVRLTSNLDAGGYTLCRVRTASGPG